MASGEPPPPISALVVPLVIWGRKPPDLIITVVRYLNDGVTIVTGSTNGHVVTWKCVDECLTPFHMMIGHEAPITAVSPINELPSSTRFISASADGRVCLWDTIDGRCVDSVISTNVHRYVQPYTYKSSRHTRSNWLFCIGDYSDISVMDPQDLTVSFQLGSRVEADWLCAYEVVRRVGRTDQCIGISLAGMIKVWTLVELEQKDSATPLYEDESRRLALKDVRAMSYNPVNEHLLLVVCFRSFQLINISDLTIIIDHECSSAIDGKLLDVDKVAVAFADRTLRIFQLPVEKLKGAQVRERFGEMSTNIFGISEPFELAVLKGPKSSPRSWLNDVTFTFSPQQNGNLYQATCGTRSGELYTWRIPQFNKDIYSKFSSITQFPLTYDSCHHEAFSSIWESLNKDEVSSMIELIDEEVASSLYVDSQGKLLVGRTDGLIVMTYAPETLACQLLGVKSEKTTIHHLRGHKSAVRSLFYPHEHHPRFDPLVFMSGGDDFDVILWNISTAAQLHRFCEHGGPILRFIVTPPYTSKLVSECVCALSADNEISLLNISEYKCIMNSSRHQYPVTVVKWLPLANLMVVRHENGAVNVWNIETATLDRTIGGVAAEEMLAACDEQIGKEEWAGKGSLSTLNGTSVGSTEPESPSSSYVRGMNALQYRQPMSLIPVPGCRHRAHLIHINVANLIGGITYLDHIDIDDINKHRIPITTAVVESQNSSLGIGLQSQFTWQFAINLYLDIARLLLSLLHAWNLDNDLDAVCTKKLGLSKPRRQLYFGNMSRQGQLTVSLPQRTPILFDTFSTEMRWQASHLLTTTHLLAIVSTANTLMSMKNLAVQIENTRSSFSLQAQSRKKLTPETVASERHQLKQGWNLLVALHCVHLPDHVFPRSSYAAPRIELLARRWQDGCAQIREAAQTLLIRELSRLGSSGRRRLIESWTPFLPPLLDPELSIFGARLQSSVPTLPPSAPPISPRQTNSPPPLSPSSEPSKEENGDSGVQQVRRNQATAIILLGVMGAEFSEELNRADLTRATALSLLELLVAAPSSLLPVHSPLRRAAIDLLGRGFVHWEPHLEICKVVLGLLDLAANVDKRPSASTDGVQLSPITDACHTARRALTLIAITRPTALLSALSMEVARYNSAAQHQTIQHTVVSPLLKSRSEVLRIIDELTQKRYNEVVEMMLPVGDVLVHCLDTSLLTQKTLADVFPPITKFPMVAYCSSTRRIAFGGKNGSCVVHDIRAAKTHNLHAHKGPISAVAFSDDGKFLATYGGDDAKINFWQTTQSFLGMGQSQMKLVKTQQAPSLHSALSGPNGTIADFRPKLKWINAKALTLVLPEGREQRFTL